MVLSIQVEQVTIPADKGSVDGVLWLPPDPVGIVLFADSRGGYRVKPPIDYVGSVLRNSRLGTLWLDLMPPRHGIGQEPAGDTELLTRRLDAACSWLRENDATRELPVGLFGASNGAAAVLQLAANLGATVFAVVLRGARADLAAYGSLGKVNAPTLLIVGSLDDSMVVANRGVYAALRCKKRLEIIPGATHNFEEPGSLEVVARLARGWFLQNVRVKHV
ncbi:MAG TPA: alpha/beta hydrolase [Noviherbaspirillum sp.]|uniref:dienelactone hydrolase family protein n=1 Tax=Noviherbaspirillum sp. TaxID=1926288 RepID=UPI002D3F39A3|nr:alpha/beta hydrolase [Noviherbaspirillum sp.]HYD94895.1 alpha/beta hydrolase [Noviherbaspirillum sp.]